MKSLFSKGIQLLGLILLISCGGNSKSQNTQNEVVTENGKIANPETSNPNSPEYKPAFLGQTRVEGIKLSLIHI